jgi:hypothetical protein
MIIIGIGTGMVLSVILNAQLDSREGVFDGVQDRHPGYRKVQHSESPGEPQSFSKRIGCIE